MYVKGDMYKVNNPLHFCINKGDIFTLVDDTYKLYDGYQTLYLNVHDINEVFNDDKDRRI